MVNLRCPVCAGALEKRAGAYLCPKNHSFDIAKSGYVNLLLNSSQGHHGDDKLMVRARRDFLDKGYYDRFIAAVADAAAEFTPPEATVLDAGCGEGIYSLAVLRAIEKAGKHGELLGVDISKTALQYASKRSPDFTLCVASCAHLPVEDGSVDEVLNICSPFASICGNSKRSSTTRRATTRPRRLRLRASRSSKRAKCAISFIYPVMRIFYLCSA